MNKELLLFFAIIGVSLILFGQQFNLKAMQNNECKMPVHSHNWIFDTDTHFSYENNAEVNNWIFTDLFNINDFMIFSIGDVLLFIGLGLFLIFMGIYTFLSWKLTILERRYKK